jgi:hypothetical protein
MKSKRLGSDDIKMPEHFDEEELLRDKYTSDSGVFLIGAQETSQ